MPNKRAIRGVDAARPEKKTQSGDLERPETKRRKIDCGEDPVERRQPRRGADRRNTGLVHPPSPEP